jgi:CRP-like cAMP-binding protein
MTLFEGGDYHETAIAMEDTEVAIIPKDEFQALIQKNRDVATNFIKMLSGDVQEKEKRLLQLAYASVRERVADSLITLKEKRSESGDGSNKLVIAREDLANMIGTAKESLIRTLSELKKEGLVETDGQEIRIIDEDGLRRAAIGM